MLRLFFFSLALGEEQPPQENMFSFVEVASVYEQVQALQALQPPFTVTERRRLWTLYFNSRLGVQAEDPDIFERVLDLLIDDYQRQVDIDIDLSSELLPSLYAASIAHIQHQWSHRYPALQNISHAKLSHDPSLASEIEQQWKRHGIRWLRSFQTEQGSRSIELFRTLLNSLIPHLKEQISPQFTVELKDHWGLYDPTFSLSPPAYLPGQTETEAPKRPEMSLIKFSPDRFIPWKWIVLGICSISIFGRRHRIARYLSALLPLMLLENLLSLSVQPLIKSDSFFSFRHWQIEPWVDKEQYLETQGSYIRAQRFTKDKEQKRIVILGASSAHGSNHLWEDSFAGIIEQETSFEVINLSIGGTTSHGILHLLPYTLSLDPDLVILYYGHNEVHQFRQLPEFQNISVYQLWMKNILWRSTLYSLLYKQLAPLQATEAPPTHEEKESQHEQDALSKLAIWNHKQNISLLLEGYSERDIPVVLLNPPTNYPFAPVDERFNQVPVSTILEKQQQIDRSIHATTIHSGIRENNLLLAKRFGLYYLDLDLYFHQESSDHFSANGLFWDELHPSITGHQWIARPIISFLRTQAP